MSQGILQLALSGTVDLELEYREPGSKDSGTPQEHAAAQQLHGSHALAQIADALPAWLHVI
jgi:hypothetical protein